MKKQILTAMVMLAAMGMFALSNPVYAQAGGNQWGGGPGEFIDENGDGFNDLAPDADGDGIPNAYDEDYVSGGNAHGNGTGEFIDENGDGYNDLAPDEDGDGIPNAYDEDYVRPQDGSGAAAGFGQGNGSGAGQGGSQGGSQGGHNGNGPGDGSGVGPGNGKCIAEPAEPVQSRFQLNSAR